jgi:glycopeptide antibiotics resistance protein
MKTPAKNFWLWACLICAVVIVYVTISPITFIPSFDALIYHGIDDIKQWIKSFAQRHFSETITLYLFAMKDELLNFFLFVPLGFFTSVLVIHYHKGIFWAVVTAIFLSAAVSLIIELCEIYLPYRYPSQTDLLINTIGGGTAALLAAIFSPLFSKKQAKEK